MLTLRQLSHLESSGLGGWKPGRSEILLPPLHCCHCHRGCCCSSSPVLRCNSYTIQVLNSGDFGIFTSCVIIISLKFQNILSPPKEDLWYSLAIISYPFFPSLEANIFSPFKHFYINGIMKYEAFCIWLLSLSMMF